jgi:TP901 family phage tail tape measure protein
VFGFKLAEAIIALRSTGGAQIRRELTGIHKRLGGMTRMPGMIGLAGGGAAVAGIAKSAMTAEVAFAGVAKTTGLAGAELEELKNKVDALGRELAGISNAELRGLAQIGGQLGITGDLLPKFVEDLAKAKVALDLDPESTAEAMSELNTQFRFGLENVNQVTSAINELSNTTRATPGDIMEVSRRLSGKGATLGLSPQEVFAFATSMREAGVTAEVAGTSVGKLMGMIADPKHLKSFASVTDMTAESFGKLVKESPFEALKKTIQALSEAKGGAAFGVLEEMGIDDQRGQAAMLQLARAFDTLEKNITTSNNAFAEGTSVQKEYEVFAATASAAMQKMNNNVEQAAAAWGEALLPGIKEATALIGNMSNSVRENKEEWGEWSKGVVQDIEGVLQALRIMNMEESKDKDRDTGAKRKEFEAARDAEKDPAKRAQLAKRIGELALEEEKDLARQREKLEAQQIEVTGPSSWIASKILGKADPEKLKELEEREADARRQVLLSKKLAEAEGAAPETIKSIEESFKQSLDMKPSPLFGPSRFQPPKELPKPKPIEEQGEAMKGPAEVWGKNVKSALEKATESQQKKADALRQKQLDTANAMKGEHGGLLKAIDDKLGKGIVARAG